MYVTCKKKTKTSLKAVQKKDKCVERPTVCLGDDQCVTVQTRTVPPGPPGARHGDSKMGARAAMPRQGRHRNGACEEGGREGVDGAIAAVCM